MTRIVRFGISLALLVTVAVGCGSEDDTGGGWGGDAPHIRFTGTLNGEALDYDMPADVATDPAMVYCTREYEVPVVDGAPVLADAVYVETKIDAIVTIGGETRIAEIELKQHAMDEDKVGAEIAIVPRVDGVDTASDEMWFEWEWHTLDDQDLYESAALQGSFKLRMFTGTGGGARIIPEGVGAVGGVVTALWSAEEEVELSFTAPCTTNKISEIQ